VLTPSGTSTLAATAGDVLVARGGELDADGLSNLDFRVARFGTPGGQVTLSAQAGDIRIANGARLGVDGARGHWDTAAGAITLRAAAGQVEVADGALLSGSAQDPASAARSARMRWTSALPRWRI